MLQETQAKTQPRREFFGGQDRALGFKPKFQPKTTRLSLAPDVLSQLSSYYIQ
jgi:hypothetical protein